jgi:hypothetical protein
VRAVRRVHLHQPRGRQSSVDRRRLLLADVPDGDRLRRRRRGGQQRAPTRGVLQQGRVLAVHGPVHVLQRCVRSCVPVIAIRCVTAAAAPATATAVTTGFEGLACERTSCPSACNYRGVCISEYELADAASREYRCVLCVCARTT